MIVVSATKLRQNLFELLEKVVNGETIVIQRNNEEVARLVSLRRTNWRERMTVKPEILVSSEELLKPIEEGWEEYS